MARLCRLLALAVLLPVALAAQERPALRLAFGPDARILLLADSATGLTLWAAGVHRPDRWPAPDFVGWFDPDSVRAWLPLARALLATERPPAEDAIETPGLAAVDGGFLTLALIGGDSGRQYLLTFGHQRQRERWFLAGSGGDWGRLLDSLGAMAHRSRLAPPRGLGYANPTEVAVTPDRSPDSPFPAPGPGETGEVWARAELDSAGAVIAGSVRLLWSDAPRLAQSVRELLPRYHYDRRDSGVPARLRIYQRFRAR